MIKAIIFDLDGVLVDTKMIHYDSLNISLEKYKFEKISIDEHVRIFDGLPTVEKLNILNKRKSVPKKFFSKIRKYKQKVTTKILKKKIKKNKKKFKIFKKQEKKARTRSNSGIR